MTPKEELVARLAKDRVLAHRVLFAHRHEDATPAFHEEIIRLWSTPLPRHSLLKSFRGSAKSTLAEESLLLDIVFRKLDYGIIIGNSYTQACKRLAAIKHEAENNEFLGELFGDLKGGTWSENEAVFANGAKLECFGARQALRGAKHLEFRPQRCVVDDLEDEDNAATEDAREKIWDWFFSVLLPAMTSPRERVVDVLGTPLHPQSVIERISQLSDWRVRTFPVEHLDTTGARAATWPARFSLEDIDGIRASYAASGRATAFAQEYLCVAEAKESKPFQARHIRVAVGPVNEWSSRYLMVDPARTTHSTSARTGYAVWSYPGPSRILIHDAFGARHLPDQIIETIFALDQTHRPTLVGVEADGLEEFLAQPLRAAMATRGRLAYEAVRAPRDQRGFIMGLQPFFEAGEVEMERDFPDLKRELLGFPTEPLCDVVNALAYALLLRPGQAVYPDFSPGVHADAVTVNPRLPLWLTMHATPTDVVGILVQHQDGRLAVVADWVRQGSPNDVAIDIAREARMLAGATVRLIAPDEHFDAYANVGLVSSLRQSVARAPASPRARGALTSWLRGYRAGRPAFTVDPGAARWTANALAGGYARPVSRKGGIEDAPKPGPYRLVGEAIDTFAAWLEMITAAQEDGPVRKLITRSRE